MKKNITEEQNKILTCLDNLVGQRFDDRDALAEKLSELFGKEIKCVYNEFEQTDYNDYKYTIATKDFQGETDGIGEVFFLRTRQNQIYVTETSFEFGI